MAATDDPPCALAPVRNLLIFGWEKLSGEKWGGGDDIRGRRRDEMKEKIERKRVTSVY